MPARIDTLAREFSAGRSPDEIAALVAKVRAQAARLRIINDCPTGLDLACRFDPTVVRTPAIELIATRLKEAVTESSGRLVVSMPPQEGKALDTDTPILTTAGWSTMGDLQVGDEVFHPDGHATRVVGAYQVSRGRQCYQVTTADGRSVIADGEHLWTVQDKRREKSKGPQRARVRSFVWETLTTEQILARGLLRDDRLRSNGSAHRAYAFRLPPQRAVVSKPIDLPIDPYLFGAWLGDGGSRAASLSVGDLDVDEITTLIESTSARIVSKKRWRTAWLVRFSTGAMRDGFESRCRQLGVWGNKHVPDIYLTAGLEQRLALLQGLLDTDGSIFRTQTSSRVEFSSSRKGLAEAVLYLVRSLGWRATIRESAAILNNREVGRRWRVCFTPEQGGYAPFRLRRKADRVQVSQSRAGELHAVSIVSIEPVESRPVRCIRVEREDGLFLAGRDLIATHNTQNLEWLCLWLLIDDPDRRIVFASYSSFLARRSGREVRALIESFGDTIGLSLAGDHSDASDWQVAGRRGGMVSVGVGGSLTGRSAEVLIIDDALRGWQDAYSDTVRGRLHDWWSSVARTRLAPGAPVIVVGTRWHLDDLSGRLIEQGWPALNIPALADGKTPDALDRPAGEWLTSARNRTVAEWLQIAKDAGERPFAALYQGRPAPLGGGIFKSDWFATWRVPEAPAGCLPPTVVVDPADNEGDGDEAGIILATSHPATGRVYILDDLSASMTVARWARVALLTCARRSAPTLAYEKSLSQLPKRIREAWQVLRQQAVALRRTGGDVDAALVRLTRPDDTAEAQEQTATALIEIVSDVDAILAIPDSGPRLKPITARGSKTLRMQLVAPMFETGRAVMVGHHPALEYQASVWQVGQDSPDRCDAMSHACALLSGAGETSLGRSRDRVPTRSTGTRSSSATIPRSVRR
jgi:hypothetical protein